jgi:capsular exopolysaccharide synthesis family protein
VLVTSASAGEGKTVTAANLAVAFAQAGRRVLLVDADLRKPGIHLIFDLSNERGLTSLLRTDSPGLESVARAPDQENLLVVTSGPLPPNPAELLGSQRMRTLKEQLAAEADLVIFDSPPVHAVADPLILSALVDGTLLVIDSAHSRPQSVRLAGDTLARAGAHVLGVVLNQLPAGSRSEYAGYYGGYGSEAGAERAPQPAGTPKVGSGGSAHLPGAG